MSLAYTELDVATVAANAHMASTSTASLTDSPSLPASEQGTPGNPVGRTRKKRIHLGSMDPVFPKIRDLNFAAVQDEIGRLARLNQELEQVIFCFVILG